MKTIPVTYSLAKCASKKKEKRKETENISRKVPVDLSKLKYEDMLPVYNLWKQYWEDLACSSDTERLSKADFHGCLVMVTRAENPTMVGLHGIVCRETKNTFYLVKKNNCSVCIPKQGSTFEFVLDARVYTLFGDNLRNTSVGRVQKKIKNTSLPYLLPTKIS